MGGFTPEEIRGSLPSRVLVGRDLPQGNRGPAAKVSNAEKTIEERTRGEIALLKVQIKAKQAELRFEEARLEQATSLENDQRRLHEKNPGALSEAECKKAEVASAAAGCHLKRAELRLLELRLGQKDQ